MKIEQGFVAVTPDGEYLRWSERDSHTGYHLTFSTTLNIEEATFSHAPNFRGLRSTRAPPHTWVPVERRVEVILKGYGI